MSQTSVLPEQTSQPSSAQPTLSNVDQLQQHFTRVGDFYRQNLYPSFEYRQVLLKKLQSALLDHKDQLCNAVHQDFGNRCASETLFLEVAQVVDHIQHTLRHLKSWMKPENRLLPIQLMPGTSQIVPQPKGVVGIISPWNYPVLLSLSPLVTALSAGNTALIKGSELTSQTNIVLTDICEQAFDGNNAIFVQGDAEFAAAFCALPFDHLFFTGSPAVGKKVMAAAANNLTPVTLELGGKSPVIIGQNYGLKKAANAIIFGKMINAGQTCIAPDYILCPEEKVDQLVEQLIATAKKMYPDQMNNEDYTSIISDEHFKRLHHMLEDAKSKNAAIVHTSSMDRQPEGSRVLPLSLLTNVSSDMQALQEEIFGPILPIIAVKSIDEAINYINRNDPPLALYLFSDDSDVQEKVKLNTHAGGMCINDTITHVASQNLPFGGIRQSGIGCYHGKEGFMELSHKKSVLKRGKWNPTTLIAPPWNQKIHKVLMKMLVR